MHHAESRRHGNEGTWSTYFERQTVWQGPLSQIIAHLAELERNGSTSVYDGRPQSNGAEFEVYRNRLQILSNTVEIMNSTLAPSLLLCAFWTGVSEEVNQDFLPVYNTRTCVQAIVAWSKVLLAHRLYHCSPSCPFVVHDRSRSFLWNTRIPWKIRNDDYTAGASLALAYDVLQSKMSVAEQRTTRSAIAMLVMNRFSWGICPVSSQHCPDVFSEPHRIVDVNAMYHSNLFLTNLAIEGESDFDAYTTDVLRKNNAEGFNSELSYRFLTLLKTFMQQAVYPDGSTVQGGGFYTNGLREGSLALIAAQRRGLNLLDTPRFRNLVHFSSQIMEPWECGRLPDESSEATHNTFVALFNFLFPASEFVSIMWRQRIGQLRPRSCSKLGWRSVSQLLFLAREPVPFKHNYGILPASALRHFPLKAYFPHRGLLVARTGLGSLHAYVQFDIRSDTVLDGRDAGGHGDFLFAVGGHTWFQSFGEHSREKSLLHIDGVAQEDIAPPAKLLRIESRNGALIAVADLTYAYNTQWARGEKEQLRYNTMFDRTTKAAYRTAVRFSRKETYVPFSNLSMAANFVKRIWKRKTRAEEAQSVIRSICLLDGRASDLKAALGASYGALIISDYVNPGRGSHLVESYLALSNGTIVFNLSCSQNPYEPQCALTLMSPKHGKAVVHIMSHVPLRARTENVGARIRVIVSAEARRPIRIWTGIAAHGLPTLKMRLLKEGVVVQHGEKSEFLHAGHGEGIHRATQTSPGLLYNGGFAVLNATSMKPVLSGPQTFEANIKVRAESRSGMDDVISTCGHRTSARTRIRVFFCESKECKEVPGSGRPCSKASGRQEWRGQLKGGLIYNVRIAVESIDGLLSIVEARYRLRRRRGSSLR
ncbi:Chondroitin AC/alginate lyase [Gracilaria domingensis]|nr:Chondroitin AC/alginate lyase [Gracilaria domingensis]